jgi:hypothetical protein
VQQHTVVQKHRIGSTDEDGNQSSEFEVTRTTKQMGVPSWAVSEALKESSLINAVHTLASEGVIPASVAKKILSETNKIVAAVKESFDISPDADFINDKKAIALIKAAVLGEVEI